MNFNEYKNAEYWQKERQEAAKKCAENFATALLMTGVFAIFPVLYCLAGILDG